MATTRRCGAAKASYSQLKGWKTLTLENELLSVTVLPEYGGWIYSVFHKGRQVELLWQCPRGLRAKDDPVLAPDPLLAYAARTLGAWPEIFPHGSGPAEANGVKLPMHGEVVHRAWEHGIIKARGIEAAAHMGVQCHLMPLRLERVLRVVAGRAVFELEETVTNYARVPADFMWGHHPLFGKPLLSASSRIMAPAARWLDDDAFKPTPWPVHEGRDQAACPAEGAETGQMFYLDSLSAGWIALVNPVEKLGAALSWDPAVFPCVWIWREANSSKRYPYFGTAYAAALEPFSNLPGARTRGEKLLHLEPGASLTTRLCLTAFEGLTDVTHVSADGEVR